MLQVMPGDRFTLSAESYFDAVGNTDANTPEELAGSLFTALSGDSLYNNIPVGENPQNMAVLQNIVGRPDFGQLYNDMLGQNTDTSIPSSYLKYLFFDEQFILVGDNSGIIQCGATSSQWNTIGTSGAVSIGQPGYILFFTSSRITSPVFYNNVNVTYYRGTLLEQNHHYYPFGLTLTSAAVNPAEQSNIKFQSQKLESDFGLNWYAYKYRMHDMQIGRFTGIDPLAEKYVYNSTYAFSENKVTNAIELEGLEAWYINEPVDGNDLRMAKSGGFNLDIIHPEAYGSYSNEYTQQQNLRDGPTIKLNESIVNSNYDSYEARHYACEKIITYNKLIPSDYNPAYHPSRLDVPDAIGLTFSAPFLWGGGASQSFSIGYMKNNGFFATSTTDGSVGADVSFGVSLFSAHSNKNVYVDFNTFKGLSAP